MFFYSSLFFQGVIDDPLVGTTILGAINVLATYLALNLLNRYGRRTLIMVSSGGMCFSCVLLIISMRGYFGKMMPLIAVAMCVVFYGIGVGPIPVSTTYYAFVCSGFGSWSFNRLFALFSLSLSLSRISSSLKCLMQNM